MSDLILFFGSLSGCAVVAAIYVLLDRYLARRVDCKHEWTKWADPVTGDGFPYQLRACRKCNAYESRQVRGGGA